MPSDVYEFILNFLAISCGVALPFSLLLKGIKIFARAFSKGVLSID